MITVNSKKKNGSFGKTKSQTTRRIRRNYGAICYLCWDGMGSHLLPTPSFSPDAYLDFLGEKVQRVRAETSGSQAPSFNATPHSFSVLQQCSIEELEKVIRSSPTKSCELDPIPTFLLKEFLNDLLPCLHLLCNSSLSTGILPCSQTKAIVTPALKKHGLDSDVLNNFRPISNLSYLSKIVEKLVSMQLIAYLNDMDCCRVSSPVFVLDTQLRRFWFGCSRIFSRPRIGVK